MPALGLIKRKEIWVPTLRGWALLAIALAGLWLGAIAFTVPFLAPVRPEHRGILVVEGWLPDYALGEAKRIFEKYGYEFMIVTGVPIDQGFHISKEKNYAQLAATTLKHMGMQEALIVPVPCPEVTRDRTYATARQVRRWLEDKSPGRPLDIFTLGVHARRTWLLYRMALGPKYAPGIIAGADERYDPRHWWKSSSGVRTVTSEVIAYLYAKLFFSPRREIKSEDRNPSSE